MVRFATRPVLMLLLVLAVSVPATGSVFVKLELPDLVRHADEGIIVGEVVDTRSYWNADRSMIFTDSTVRVTDDLTGKRSPGETMTFRTPGGRVGDVKAVTHGAPAFEVGARIVVFASRWSDGALSVVGYVQGLSRLDEPSTGHPRLVNGTADGMTLDELRGFVASRGNPEQER